MYQAKSGVKNFPFTGGRGGGGGREGPHDKKIFSGLNMYQAKSGVKIFSLNLGDGGGVPLTKNFSLV